MLQQPSTSPMKPSPLSFGSPRGSPFRRPESPQQHSPSTVRANTPTQPLSPNSSSSNRPASAVFSPKSPSPRANPSTPSSRGARTTPNRNAGDPLSRLNPAQIHELRECFQVLDGDNDGQVTKEDVIDALTQLGQDPTPAALALFFSSAQQTLSLPAFLNTLASLLAPLSDATELHAAFNAFDVDDSGQIDADELREVLLRTTPAPGEKALSAQEIDSVMEGFSARRAFGGKGGAGKKGEVFKYGEFMAAVSAGGGASATAGQTQEVKG